MLLIAGEPAPGRWVLVGPPLFARGPSRGSAITSPGPLKNGQQSTDMTFQPPELDRPQPVAGATTMAEARIVNEQLHVAPNVPRPALPVKVDAVTGHDTGPGAAPTQMAPPVNDPVPLNVLFTTEPGTPARCRAPPSPLNPGAWLLTKVLGRMSAGPPTTATPPPWAMPFVMRLSL